jgi:wyosine [tRNA(Phe)-imidazoG37] synthetase (radical SAM superfamily)
MSQENQSLSDYKYIFGPVRSGRLGLSLGLDLLGERICTFDCLYCEVGKTRMHTLKRDSYVSAEAILQELDRWLKENRPHPDYITLGGMGEPCLNKDLGKIIAGARELAPNIPTAILTNSSLLGSKRVRRDISLCQVILPSLDSLVQKEFMTLNRPCVKLKAEKIAQNLLKLREEYSGQIFLEILLVRGINDTDENLARLKDFIQSLRPDRVDVVTMTRPGAYARSLPVPQETLDKWRKALKAKETAGQEIHIQEKDIASALDYHLIEQKITNSLKRRPQSVSQLAWALALPLDEVQKTLKRLLKENKATVVATQDQEDFFALTENR